MTTARACAVGDVSDGSALRCDVRGIPVCVAHVGSDWFAIGDVCSHANFSLADGEVWADEFEIECPKHGALFSLRSGEPQTLPATVAVAVFAITVSGDDVLVEIGDDVKADA